MLSPRPVFPLQISMLLSQPTTIGQLMGSGVTEHDPGHSNLPMGEVLVAEREEEDEEERGRVREEEGERRKGWEEEEERGREEEEDRGLERLMESLIAVRCFRSKLYTYKDRENGSYVRMYRCIDQSINQWTAFFI